MNKQVLTNYFKNCIIILKERGVVRKYSEKYKIWHDKRCRRLAKKCSIHKKRKKNKNISSHFKPKSFHIIAPINLSFTSNKEETNHFFSEIVKVYQGKNKKNNHSVDKMLLDLSNVKYVTSETITYLIAIINNLKFKILRKLEITYEFPNSMSVKERLSNFGLFDCFNVHSDYNLLSKKSNIQIITGDKVDPEKVSQIIDFIKINLSKDGIFLRYLYTMLIEIITNTVQHAYNKDNILSNHWYLCIEVEDKINITILDTGEGIPATISKKVIDVFKIFNNKESRLISSALNGKLRTETKMSYRGKGLPQILKSFESNNIESLYIISGKGSILIHEGSEKRKLSDSNESLLGTVFSICI